MPMEGHWDRGHAPLRTLTGRERRAFAAIAAVTALIAAAVLAWALLRGGDAPSRSGCVDTFVGSTMGAARVQACGGQALRVCRSRGAAAQPTLARECAALLDRTAKRGG